MRGSNEGREIDECEVEDHAGDTSSANVWNTQTCIAHAAAMTIAAVNAAVAFFGTDRSQPRPSDTREDTPPFGSTANSRQSAQRASCTVLLSTSSGAASTAATHTAFDHHCLSSAPSPATAAFIEFSDLAVAQPSEAITADLPPFHRWESRKASTLLPL